MLYYQVTDKLASKNGNFVARELFTEKEMDKKGLSKNKPDLYVKRNVKKTDIYKMFGVRRQINDPFTPLKFRCVECGENRWVELNDSLVSKAGKLKEIKISKIEISAFKGEKYLIVDLKKPCSFDEVAKVYTNNTNNGCWCSKDFEIIVNLYEKRQLFGGK